MIDEDKREKEICSLLQSWEGIRTEILQGIIKQEEEMIKAEILNFARYMCETDDDINYATLYLQKRDITEKI